MKVAPKHAPRESKTSEKQLSAVERQRQALELRKSGAGYQQIADALGYASPSGAYQAIRRALQKTLQEPADEVRKMELERLDRLQMAAWGFAIQGDPRSIETVLKIMKRRAELLGIDAPARINIARTIEDEIDRMVEAGLLDADERAAAVAEAEAIVRGQA